MKKFVFLLLVAGIFIASCSSTPQPCTPVKTEHSTPEWSKNLSIYELNVRQFSEEGTFKAIENRLDELKAMNVGIIWLMPIHPIGEKERKGSLGSYYAVKDYKDVNPNYGTKQDFADLVKAVHDKGMFLIIDWVANHSAPDNVWTKEHSDYFTKNEKGEFVPPVADWSDTIDLNYDNPEMRKAMIDALEYWVREFNIDGYRCDVAEMVPTDFWNDARKALDQIKPVFMLAEAEKEEHHAKAFDMSYGWEMHHYFNEIAKGNKNVTDFLDLIKREDCRFDEAAYRMRFVDNHDENSWNGFTSERMGNAEQAMIVLSATIPGMPLLYSGNEAGLDKRLQFFDKDPIVWKAHPNRALYTKLFELKKQTPALFNGIYGGDFEILPQTDEQVIVFKRKLDMSEIIVFINLSNKPIKKQFGSDVFSAPSYHNYFGNYSMEMNLGWDINFEPWQYEILVAEK